MVRCSLGWLRIGAFSRSAETLELSFFLGSFLRFASVNVGGVTGCLRRVWIVQVCPHVEPGFQSLRFRSLRRLMLEKLVVVARPFFAGEVGADIYLCRFGIGAAGCGQIYIT